ncbi:MAG: 30S ribosomal protein S16 [Patescibacteria group bacterium]
MLVIRLSRTGRTKRPHYRVVVAEKSAAVKGRYLEVLGHYDPLTKELKVDADRTKQRLASGAQPSETAEMLLEKAGVLKREKITEKNRRPERKKRKEAKAEAEGGAAPAKDEPAAKPDEAEAKAGEGGAPEAASAKDDSAAKKTGDAGSADKAEAKSADQPAEDSGDDKQSADKEKDKEKGGS